LLESNFVLDIFSKYSRSELPIYCASMSFIGTRSIFQFGKSYAMKKDIYNRISHCYSPIVASCAKQSPWVRNMARLLPLPFVIIIE
jgi:hypothetical protein